MRAPSLIARRYLSGSGRAPLSLRATLAMIGVAIMVAQWIVIVCVQIGFIDTFRDSVVGASAHITLNRYGVYFSDYRQLQAQIEEVPGVVASAPYINYQMQISGQVRGSRPGVVVKGVEIDTIGLMTNLPTLVTAGSLDALRFVPEEVGDGVQYVPTVALGSVLAERIGVGVGDVVRLSSPLAAMRDLGITSDETGPTSTDARVGAIVNVGFYDYDSKLVLTDFRALQHLFRRGDAVTGLEIRIEDAFQAVPIAQAIEQRVGPSRYLVLPWPELHNNLFASLQLQKLAFTIVSTAGLIVSSFLVLCVLIMIVLEKRKEIGILRSMGMERRGVMQIFIWQGFIIGTVGAVGGALLAWVICEVIANIDFSLAIEVYRIDHLPVSRDPATFLQGALGAAALSLLATLYPAWRASRVVPMEAIRHD